MLIIIVIFKQDIFELFFDVRQSISIVEWITRIKACKTLFDYFIKVFLKNTTTEENYPHFYYRTKQKSKVQKCLINQANIK